MAHCYYRILSVVAVSLLFHRPTESHPDDRVIRSSNRLALKMQDMSPHENFVWSPFGLTEVLSMIYGGANGASRKILRKTLKYSYKESLISFTELRRYLKRRSIMQSRNLLLCQKGYRVRKGHALTIKGQHNASILYVDFGKEKTKEVIDTWVRKSTENRLSYFIDEEFDPRTKALFLNVISFSDRWMYEFSKSREKLLFRNFDHGRAAVPSMKITTNLRYYRDKFSQLVAIPYKHSKISMLIFIPNIDIDKFEKHLAKRNIFDNYLSNLKFKWMELVIPKFHVESNEDLSGALMKRGYDSLFRGRLNLSRMFKDGQFQLTNLMHKAAIEVDEKGSSAWAASVGQLRWRSGSPATKKIHVNRPFVFFIYDWTKNLILFSGHVVNLT